MGAYRPCRPVLVAALALVLATGGCSSILGDFLIGNVDQDAGTGGAADAGGSEAQADGAAGADANAEAGGRDASDAAAPRPDTGGGVDASDATASDAEGGVADDAGDAGVQDADSGEAAPPPIPGKPGFGITAGGNVSRSPNYKLIGAVGESPGGNVIGRSSNYTLRGGVVGGTQ